MQQQIKFVAAIAILLVAVSQKVCGQSTEPTNANGNNNGFGLSNLFNGLRDRIPSLNDLTTPTNGNEMLNNNDLTVTPSSLTNELNNGINQNEQQTSPSMLNQQQQQQQQQQQMNQQQQQQPNWQQMFQQGQGMWNMPPPHRNPMGPPPPPPFMMQGGFNPFQMFNPMQGMMSQGMMPFGQQFPFGGPNQMMANGNGGMFSRMGSQLGGQMDTMLGRLRN